jgi:hypothetical protein
MHSDSEEEEAVPSGTTLVAHRCVLHGRYRSSKPGQHALGIGGRRVDHLDPGQAAQLGQALRNASDPVLNTMLALQAPMSDFDYKRVPFRVTARIALRCAESPIFAPWQSL